MANHLVANLLFGRGSTAAPFWEAAAIVACALGLALVALPGVRKLAERIPAPAAAPIPPAAPTEALAPNAARA